MRTIKALIFIITLGLLTFPVKQAKCSTQVTMLEQQYKNAQKTTSSIENQKKKSLMEVGLFAKKLSKLKINAKKGGLLGLPSRLRLPSARSKAQGLSQHVEKINQKLLKKKQQLHQIYKKLKRAYRSKIFKLHRKLKAQPKGFQAQRQRALLSLYKTRYRQMRNSQSQRSKQKRKRNRLQIDPLDGSNEIKQKADAIKDIEDRLKNQLLKNKKKLRKVKRAIQRQKNDRQLEDQTGEMLEEEEIFEEGERSSRSVGKRTKQQPKVKSEAGKNVQQGSGSPSVKAPQSGAAERNTASDSARRSGPGTKGPSPSPSLRSASNSQQRYQHRLAAQPDAKQRALLLDETPKGTLKQQKQFLHRKQQLLKQLIRKLQQRHSRFLQEALRRGKKKNHRR